MQDEKKVNLVFLKEVFFDASNDHHKVIPLVDVDQFAFNISFLRNTLFSCID